VCVKFYQLRRTFARQLMEVGPPHRHRTAALWPWQPAEHLVVSVPARAIIRRSYDTAVTRLLGATTTALTRERSPRIPTREAR